MNDFFQRCCSSAHTENPSRSADERQGWLGRHGEEAAGNMQAQCISCCALSIHGHSKIEQSTKTTKRAQNPALEHPKMVQHDDVFQLCSDGPWDSGSQNTNSYRRTAASVQEWHYVLWLDGEDTSQSWKKLTCIYQP